MTSGDAPKLGAGALGALFALGAVGGLIGDMCHVESGTTAYLEDPLPYVWRSQLWFPLMTGAGTAALGWLRVRFGPRDEGGAAVAEEPGREVLAMVVAILGLYALTALIRGEPPEPAVVLVYAVAALICSRFAQARADLACGLLAAAFGVTTEIVLAAAGVFQYAEDVPSFLGVATWLPALYVAYGVVAARLGVTVAAGDETAKRVTRTG